MQTMINSPLVIESIMVAIMDRMGDSRGNSVVVGLGGNLGPVCENFVRAIARMRAFSTVVSVSSLYASSPIGPPQPDYLNAAALIRYSGTLFQLLSRLQTTEWELGRVRAEHWGPRSIDLDILWAGSEMANTSTLTVPHAELRRRIFALKPLLELQPHALDPRDESSYQSILKDLGTRGVDRIVDDRWPPQAV